MCENLRYFMSPHHFHIPVMGLAFTLDTPIKVARYGINSVVSIIEDHLIEKIRLYYARLYQIKTNPIETHEHDARARRITAYLNMTHDIVQQQVDRLKSESFNPGSDLRKYFELLPPDSKIKQLYDQMLLASAPNKEALEEYLKKQVVAGDIDVNIMTKLDKINYDKEGNPLDSHFSDALSALRGFAQSKLRSSIIFSAGLNPRLFSYCEQFPDFFPDKNGELKKKIVLKVSDFRSAAIQGRFLAKKGLWVSEFRIESGLNCGGHAFASDGLLLGPILQEFKEKISDLEKEIFETVNASHILQGRLCFAKQPQIEITAQGGIGTTQEHHFLRTHYGLKSIGWGSPFLMVPEATSVDDDTLIRLVKAKKSDYYLSHASPLGVPFNNFRNSSSEQQRISRIQKNRPGSPCYKKFLSFDTEFSERPICTASRQYQELKIKQLKTENNIDDVVKLKLSAIIEKDCLCEGLGASGLLKNDIQPEHKLTAVAICPGPNLAYFSNIFSLEQMVGHIYGRKNILNELDRPHVFANELWINISYLKDEIKKATIMQTNKSMKYFEKFKDNLICGIEYYQKLVPNMDFNSIALQNKFTSELNIAKLKLKGLLLMTSNVS